MKPWMILTALAALLVAAGIWLVWPQSPDIAAPLEMAEEIDLAEDVKPPPATPVPDEKPGSPEPEPALDQKEVLRALEEVANNQQALEDWDKQLAAACKNLVRDKKYEAAQYCFNLRLARNPEDGRAYLGRGILHARWGKRVESYWDYVKFLELEPNHIQAPQVRMIVKKYEEWASGDYAHTSGNTDKSSDTDYEDDVRSLAIYLYGAASYYKDNKPEEAKRKLRLILRLPAKYAQPYWDKAKLLLEQLESGSEEP
jgi:hypothetical protein